jgi:hypothetical protein
VNRQTRLGVWQIRNAATSSYVTCDEKRAVSVEHRRLMGSAIERDGAAHRALLAGDPPGARLAFAEAADLYRRSWEVASRTSYGRLIGMLKSAVLAGGGEEEARYAQAELGETGAESPAAAYARALAALILWDDEDADRWSERMRSGGEAFVRTAAAIGALARGDAAAYSAAIDQIVHDFEARADHLTGVAIADTALMLQQLAARRGLQADVHSSVLPSV